MPKLTKKNLKRWIRDLFIIFIGSSIIAFAIKIIYDPAGLVTGGVSGLAIILRHLAGITRIPLMPLWFWYLIFNVPIFLFAWKTDGFKNIIRTGISFLIMTAELYFLPDFELIPDDLMLTGIYGGLCFGAGTALLLRARSTTGGTDMLAYSLTKYFRHMPVGALIELLDWATIIAGAFVYPMENTLCAIISVFIMGQVIDHISASGRSAKMALIISSKPEEIANDLLETMDRGVTSIGAVGEYSNQPKKVLVCVCSKKDIPAMKDIIRDHDKKAFFIVGNVSEALGEGFVEKWY